jgi:hypothetical protein
MTDLDNLRTQCELADALDISDRRVRQLEELGVIVRHPNGGYDIDKNRRRCRIFTDHDIDLATTAVEQAARDVEDALDQIRAAPAEGRRRLAQKLGPAVGVLDGAMRLANALAPEHQRPLLNSYTTMLIGRTAGELFDLCGWQLESDSQDG